MPSSFFPSDSGFGGAVSASLAPSAPWQTYRQDQQQPNQGPAGSTPLAADSDLLDSDGAVDAALDAADDDDTLDLSLPLDSISGSSDNDDPPAATNSTADPLRAERRRSDQREKELRKARAQLARFSEINPDEYARLQDAEHKREAFEHQVGNRGRPPGQCRGLSSDSPRRLGAAAARWRHRSRYRSWLPGCRPWL